MIRRGVYQVRLVLYCISVLLLLAAALAMALLVRLVPNPLLFTVVGALLSSVIAGAWLLGRATAGTLPRPQTGKALIAFGAPAALVNLVQGHWLAAIWSLAVVLTGVGLAVRIFPSGARSSRSLAHGPVRPPVSR